MEVVPRTRSVKAGVGRFSAWVGRLFKCYRKEFGWEFDVNGKNGICSEFVTSPWQQEVASAILFVRASCGSVPLEDPAIATLTFVKFLKEEGNPYLLSIRNETSRRLQEDESGNGNGSPMGTTEKDCKQEDGGKDAPVREEPSVKNEITSNVAARAGTKDNSRPQSQYNNIPSGDREVSPAHIDQKRFDPNHDDAQVPPGSDSAKRKEGQMWFSKDSDRHDECDTKRRRLSSMERG